MSKTLDTLINEAFKIKKTELLKIQEINNKNKDEFTETIKLSLKEQIYEEIKSEIGNEIKQKAIQDAQKEIREQSMSNRIKELRTLIISGFIMSFFVGMLVNQSTDIIGYIKGTIEIQDIKATIIWIFIFLLICSMILLFIFLSDFEKVIRGLKK
jgi:beta-xylosidase